MTAQDTLLGKSMVDLLGQQRLELLMASICVWLLENQQAWLDSDRMRLRFLLPPDWAADLRNRVWPEFSASERWSRNNFGAVDTPNLVVDREDNEPAVTYAARSVARICGVLPDEAAAAFAKHKSSAELLRSIAPAPKRRRR